jgi:hypothetical protein
MKYLVLHPMGGLGNQLFQYATALSLSEKWQCPIYIDRYSGFALDFQYKRKYLLDYCGYSKSSSRSNASYWDILFFWYFIVKIKIFKSVSIMSNRQLIQDSLFNHVVVREANYFSFNPELFRLELQELVCHLYGYWQSPLYFQSISERLLLELSPTQPVSPEALELGAQIRSSESLAIGLRFYEESTDPSIHFRDGKRKEVKCLNSVLQEIHAQTQPLSYYIFCSHISPIISRLQLPIPPILVTSENGFFDPIESLWILSQAKHHLITTSSFYWWGAWLSQKFHDPKDQMIYAPDNFINKDTVPKTWKIY